MQQNSYTHTVLYLGKTFPTTQCVPVGTYGIQNTFNLYKLMKTHWNKYIQTKKNRTVGSETEKCQFKNKNKQKWTIVDIETLYSLRRIWNTWKKLWR